MPKLPIAPPPNKQTKTKTPDAQMRSCNFIADYGGPALKSAPGYAKKVQEFGDSLGKVLIKQLDLSYLRGKNKEAQMLSDGNFPFILSIAFYLSLSASLRLPFILCLPTLLTSALLPHSTLSASASCCLPSGPASASPTARLWKIICYFSGPKPYL